MKREIYWVKNKFVSRESPVHRYLKEILRETLEKSLHKNSDNFALSIFRLARD